MSSSVFAVRASHILRMVTTSINKICRVNQHVMSSVASTVSGGSSAGGGGNQGTGKKDRTDQWSSDTFSSSTAEDTLRSFASSNTVADVTTVDKTNLKGIPRDEFWMDGAVFNTSTERYCSDHPMPKTTSLVDGTTAAHEHANDEQEGRSGMFYDVLSWWEDDGTTVQHPTTSSSSIPSNDHDHDYISSHHRNRTIHATDLGFSQATIHATRTQYDKILILVCHPEHVEEDATAGDGEKDQGSRFGSASSSSSSPSPLVPNFSSLTRRGIGQALTLARVACTYCNEDTRFVPDLVVVSPSKWSVETALITFPQYAPCSVNAVPWLCHPVITSMASQTMIDGRPAQQKRYREDGSEKDTKRASKDTITAAPSCVSESKVSDEILLQRADEFLDWVHDRPEHAIVAFTERSWLDAFGRITEYDRSSQCFEDGEMRMIGIKYDEDSTAHATTN